MSSWTRIEKQSIKVEYHIPTNEPWGAAWNEVQQALMAAVTNWKLVNESALGPFDDAIRVHAGDDEIVISFDK